MAIPAAEHIVIEVTVLNDEGDEVTYLVGTEGFRTKPTDTPPNAVVLAVIESIGEYSRELFNGARVLGLTRAADCRVTLTNQGGVLDVFSRAVGSGRATARLGTRGAAYPAEYETLWVLYVQSAPADWANVVLNLADRSKRLDTAIVTAMYKGTGGLEGVVAAANGKQLVFGRPGLVPMILLDPDKQIYGVQANATDIATISGNSEFGHAFEGGVPIERGPLYNTSSELLADEPSPGQYRMYWGYVGNSISGAEFVDLAAVQSYTKGGGWLRLGGVPINDLRFGASGLLQNRVSEAPRPWRFTDLCNRVGMRDVEPAALASLAGQVEDFDLGNRLVEGAQTYTEVMNDRAQALLGTYGWNKDDAFYCARLLAPEDGTDESAYTFTEANCELESFARVPIPGMEQPVWQVTVRAGRAFPCATGTDASAELKDILSRQEYLVTFTGSCQAVKDRFPEARSVTLTIDGHDFPTTESQQAFIDAFGRLYGTQREFVYCTCTDWSATTRALDLLTKVTLQVPRFGFDAGEAMRIISVKQLTGAREVRRLRFGLWGANSGYGVWQLGGGSYPAGSGDPGGSNGGPYPPNSFPTLAAQRDTVAPFEGIFSGAIATAGQAAALLDEFTGVFTGEIAEPAGDPDFASVALLLHFGGSDGSTTITDSSSYADSKTSSSPILIETSDSVWGGSCLAYPSGTSSGATGASWTPGAARFARAGGVAYTVELWFKKTGSTTAGAVARLFNGTVLWRLQATTSADGWQITAGGTSTNFTASTGDWHFLQTVVGTDNVAVTKVDGTTVQTTGALSAWTGTPYPILNTSTTVSGGDLRIDDWRITPGVARAFAVPTEAFPDS